MSAPVITSDEIVRRIASTLRIARAYKLSRKAVTTMAKSYLKCMQIAHGTLPNVDLERAIELGMKSPPRRREAPRAEDLLPAQGEFDFAL